MNSRIKLFHILFWCIIILTPLAFFPTVIHKGRYTEELVSYPLHTDDTRLKPTLSGKIIDTYQYNSTAEILIVADWLFRYNLETHELEYNFSLYTYIEGGNPKDLVINITEIQVELDGRNLNPIHVNTLEENDIPYYLEERSDGFIVIAEYDYQETTSKLISFSELVTSLNYAAFNISTDIQEIHEFDGHSEKIRFLQMQNKTLGIIFIPVILAISLVFLVLAWRLYNSKSLENVSRLRIRFVYFPVYLTAFFGTLVLNYRIDDYWSIFVDARFNQTNSFVDLLSVIAFSTFWFLLLFIILPLFIELAVNNYNYKDMNTRSDRLRQSFKIPQITSVFETTEEYDDNTFPKDNRLRSSITSITLYQVLLVAIIILIGKVIQGPTMAVFTLGIFYNLWLFIKIRYLKILIY